MPRPSGTQWNPDDTDDDAIHDNVGSEISAITAKGSPTTSDFLLIEDAAASNAKKSITLGDLPATVDPLTTKGDVFGFDTDAARVPVGANAHVLTADSAQTLGVKWASSGDFAVRYVDPVGGSSSNDGLTLDTALDDIQDAYDNLVTVTETATGVGALDRVGVGEIILLPGGHDVGAGLILERSRPVTIRGLHKGQVWKKEIPPATIPTSGDRVETMPYIFSSGDPVNLIEFGTIPTTGLGYGFVFQDFDCWVDSASTLRVFHVPNVDYVVWERIGFQTTNVRHDDLVGIWLYVDPAISDDSAFCRIINCNTMNMALVEMGESGKFTINHGHVIRDNVIFGEGKTETLHKPAISSHWGNRNLIQSNFIQDFDQGIVIDDGARANMVLGNVGETVKTWLKLHTAYATLVMDFGNIDPVSGDILVKLSGVSEGNIGILPTGIAVQDLYGPGTSSTVWSDSSGGGANRLLATGDADVVATYASEVAVATTLTWDHGIVNVNSGGGTRAITLPDNALLKGKDYTVHREGGNDVTVTCSGSDTWDDGNTIQTLATDDASIHFFSIGDAQWKILNTEGTVTGS